MKINGQTYDVPESWLDAPLVSFLRDKLGLTGTKFGCGVGQCGACTIHLNGEPIRSCLVTVAAAQEGALTTIEGLGTDEQLHPVQQAWIEESVPQCGYCQSGQMMTAASLIEKNPTVTEEEAAVGMSGNLCRCGAYVRIRRGVVKAAGLARAAKS